MDADRFIAERRADWQRLEALLGRSDAVLRSLDPEEARELGRLYRRVVADLLKARSGTAHDETLDYLNQLVARAYGRIYGGRRLRLATVWAFLARGFPATVRRRVRAVATALAIFTTGGLFGFGAAALDPEAGSFLLSQELAELEGLNPGAPFDPNTGTMASTFIMTNNMRVCFTAFAFGITLGVGTVWILFSNGLLIGALGWRTVELDDFFHFAAFILPHGLIEIGCIAIAGGAGLILGDALLRPGEHTRRDALALNGRDALRLVAGSVPLLALCGLIEGFLTGWDALPYGAKVAFGLLTAVGLAAYLFFNERLLPDHWAHG